MNQSISTVQMFKSCPLKYKLHTIVGLRKIEDESADHHMAFGRAYHAGLEVVYKSLQARQRVEEELGSVGLTASIPDYKSTVLERAKAAFCAAYPKQLDESDNAKTQVAGCAAIESYYERYMADDKQRWRVLSVEAADTYDNGFNLHLDMVAEDLEAGGIYGFDFKTTKKTLSGQGAYQFWGKFEPNSQITRYVDFIRSRYGLCEGFYIRATSFTYSSKNTKLGPAGVRIAHEQQLFNVNDVQIEIELKSAQYWETQIEVAVMTDEWGTNTDHCQFCQFRPICKSGWTWEQDRDLILNQYRLACGAMTPNLRACALDPGHEGEHDEHTPHVADDLKIEVEI